MTIKNTLFVSMMLVVLAAAGIVGEIVVEHQDIDYSLNMDPVKAAALEELSGYIPIVFNGETKETIFGVEMYNITLDGGLYKMVEAGITWIRHND